MPSFLSTDILPQSDEVHRFDFVGTSCLRSALQQLKVEQKCAGVLVNDLLHQPVLIVSNPPFGVNSAMVNKIIKHATLQLGLVEGSAIAFIIPASYKKENAQRQFTKNWHLVSSIDLNQNERYIKVDEQSGEHKLHNKLRTVFQICELRDHERTPPSPCTNSLVFPKDLTQSV